MERSHMEYKGVQFDYTRMSKWILLTACRFIDDTTHVEIPAAIAGCPVAHLRDHLFQDCRSMESILIPEGIVAVGAYAFQKCERLREVLLPEGLTYLGKGAFYECTGLQRVELGNRLSQLQAKTFEGCQQLESCRIPDSCLDIGATVFRHCRQLRTITIPWQVSKIGVAAFDGCENLTHVRLPRSLMSLLEERTEDGRVILHTEKGDRLHTGARRIFVKQTAQISFEFYEVPAV